MSLAPPPTPIKPATALVLDVDGVINGLGLDPSADENNNIRWALAAGRGTEVVWRSAAVTRINEILETTGAELWWLTTWGDDAPRLAQVLGLRAADGVLDAHGTEWIRDACWWKRAAIKRFLTDRPDLEHVAWVDDDLRDSDAAIQCGQRLTTISPDSWTGLTDTDLDLIARALTDTRFSTNEHESQSD